MAQVTMTGTEYKNYIKAEEQLNEVLNYLFHQRHFSFPEDSVGAYTAGKWERKGEMPQWLRDKYVMALISQLMAMEDEEFERMVKANCHYYDFIEGSMACHEWSGYMDLLEDHVELRRRWEAVKAALEVEDEE